MSTGCRTVESVEAELLGCLLAAPECVVAVRELVTPRHFASPVIGELVALIGERVAAGASCDLADIYTAACRRDILPPSRMYTLLFDAFTDCLSPALAPDLALAVRRAAAVRVLRAEATHACGRLSAARDDDLPALVAEAGAHLTQLATEAASLPPRSRWEPRLVTDVGPAPVAVRVRRRLRNEVACA